MKIHLRHYARLAIAACLSLAIAFAPAAEAARRKAATRPPAHKHLKQKHAHAPAAMRHGKAHYASKARHPSHHAALAPAGTPAKLAERQAAVLPLAVKADARPKAAMPTVISTRVEDQVPSQAASQVCRIDGKTYLLADCSDLLPLHLSQNTGH